MARYIDADAFIKEVVKIQDLRRLSTATIGEALDRTPTADVVEVVRCNDCQYRDRVFDFGRGGCMNPKGLKRIVYENNYCCHGKRREGEEQ